MDSKLYAIGEILFNTRLKIELALGIKSPIVEAHIRNEAKMLGWLNDDEYVKKIQEKQKAAVINEF
jgi:hypothetical protein